MPERLAKDVMVPITEYATVGEEDSLKQALFTLRDSLASGHRTLAVLDKNGNLAGFLTTRTILKTLETLAFKDNSLAGTGWKIPLVESWARFFLKSKLEQANEVKAKDVMRPVHKIFVREDTSLPEVTRTILQNRVNHIPVLNEEQKVVGIIRAVDVLDIIGNLLDS